VNQKNEVLCSIIIRCYNEEKHIGKLFAGISQQTIKNIELILVDSGSTDSTLNIASKYQTNLVYISPEEFSFGRALNYGCKAAKGKYLVFISAHCWPIYDDWLEHLLEPFQDEKVGLVYGKQRGNEQTKFSEEQIFISWFPENSDYDQTHPFCNNANCTIRKELWNKIPYDEDLTGLEDLDWAQKAITEHKYKIVYSSSAPIIHVHEETTKSILNRYRREAIALKHIFPKERFTIFDFIKLTSINILTDISKLSINRKMFRNITDIFSFRIMQFWGTYIGFKTGDQISSSLKRTFYYPNHVKKEKKYSMEKPAKQPIDYQKFQ
jgi:glycosyltransferase involved in cell wall biosynthesis